MGRRLRLAALMLLVTPALLAAQPDTPPPGMSAAQTVARIAAGIEKNDTPEVVAASELLAIMGGSLDAQSQQKIAPLLSAGEAETLAGRFAANAAPLATSSVFAQVPVEHRLVEGLARDPQTGRMFASTVVDGRLLVSSGMGWDEYEMPAEIGGLFGMAVNAPHRRLWIATGVADPTARRDGVVSGVIEMDLDRLEMVDIKPLPAGVDGIPGDVAVTPNGDMFVSDGLKGGIYRCRPGCAALEAFLAPGRLRSPQGMVLTRDGTALIVADYAAGLARINLASGEMRWLEMRDAAMLDGIDGLVRHGRDLIAIQNGTSPRRIVRVALNGEETRVDAVEVLERANPDWGEPTLGMIADDRLVYVADGQWDVWAPGGSLNEGKTPRPTALRVLPLK